MKNTKIGIDKDFPYCIRDGELYCSTLCKNGRWERSPSDKDVKAFRTYESAEKHVLKLGLITWTIVIPYKEWEQT